jgi:hypothetical protein
MAAPIVPAPAADDVPVLLAVLHDTEAAAGHWTEAHDTDPLDAAFARLAPGHPDAPALCGWCSTPVPAGHRYCTRQCQALDWQED